MSKELRFVMLDVVFDRKIDKLRCRFGNDGLAVWLAILQDCYGRGEPSMVVETDEDFDLIARASFVPASKVAEIIEYCIAAEIFDGKAWATENRLTSHGLQRRISAVHSKRERESERYSRQKVGRKKAECVPESAQALGIGILDLNKEKEEDTDPPGKVALGENRRVWLTPEEKARFELQLGATGFAWCVAKLDSWVQEVQPKRGKPGAEALKRVHNGENARHTFDAWVIRAWRENEASLAASARKLNGHAPPALAPRPQPKLFAHEPDPLEGKTAEERKAIAARALRGTKFEKLNATETVEKLKEQA